MVIADLPTPARVPACPGCAAPLCPAGDDLLCQACGRQWTEIPIQAPSATPLALLCPATDCDQSMLVVGDRDDSLSLVPPGTVERLFYYDPGDRRLRWWPGLPRSRERLFELQGAGDGLDTLGEAAGIGAALLLPATLRSGRSLTRRLAALVPRLAVLTRVDYAFGPAGLRRFGRDLLRDPDTARSPRPARLARKMRRLGLGPTGSTELAPDYRWPRRLRVQAPSEPPGPGLPSARHVLMNFESTRPVAGSRLESVLAVALDRDSAADMLRRPLLVTGKNKLIGFCSMPAPGRVLKLALDPAAARSERRQHAVLLGLTRGDVPCNLSPRPLARGRVGPYRYFIETRLPGRPMAEAVTPTDSRRWLAPLLALLQDLNPGLGDRPAMAAPKRLGLIGALCARVRDHLGDVPGLDALERFLLGNLAQCRSVAGLVHGDLAVHNLMVDADGIVGLVDWEDARLNAPVFLDGLNALDSLRRWRDPSVGVGDNVECWILGTWPDADEAQFLAGWASRCRVDPERVAAWGCVYALQHFSDQIRYCESGIEPALARRIESFVERAAGLLGRTGAVPAQSRPQAG